MPEKICGIMHRLRRKDGSSPSVNPWLAVLLVMVVLGMNYQTTIQLQRAEMERGIRRMTQLKKNKQASPKFNPQRKDLANTTSVVNEARPKLYLPIPPRSKDIQKDLVKKGDYIYYHEANNVHWDAAPIVIESHKLVFL